MRAHWTLTEDNILRVLVTRFGARVKDCAKYLSRTVRAIRTRLWVLGIVLRGAA